MGLRRRPFLVKAALLGAAPLGLAAVAPLGALLLTTLWIAGKS
jgi:ubiquinol-cytochrome c reductase iron-sulfur subunit